MWSKQLSMAAYIQARYYYMVDLKGNAHLVPTDLSGFKLATSTHVLCMLDIYHSSPHSRSITLSFLLIFCGNLDMFGSYIPC